MIFIDALRTPIALTDIPKSIEDHDVRYADQIFARAQKLISNDNYEPFTQFVMREQIWSGSKDNLRQRKRGASLQKEFDLDLTNFERNLDEKTKSKFENKRKQKTYMKQNHQPLVTKRIAMNKFNNSRRLFEIFNIEKEIYQEEKTTEQVSNKLKPGMMRRLNEHINPVLCDMDPEECIDEEYKNKNNQIFSWKFLRAVMCMIPVNKLTSEQRKMMMLKSEIEEIATIVHQAHLPAMKRPVI